MQIHLKDFQVFGSLQKHFDLILCALDTLRDCTRYATEGSAAFAEIQNLERNGDEILRSAIQQLDCQLSDYPPREGTRRMLCQQDRVLDAIEHLAGRLAAYRLGELPGAAIQFMAIIESCADVLGDALRAFGEGQHFLEQMMKMGELENQADRLCIAAIRDLAEQESDPRRLLMLNETFGLLEKIANLFEDCIQTMEDSALKTLHGQ
ncbi:MAG: DUF47 family protein [Bryobacteraceae bacterium]|jgi:uncharacterized protein Yka (UPF0111/DUF47 family)